MLIAVTHMKVSQNKEAYLYMHTQHISTSFTHMDAHLPAQTGVLSMPA